MALSSIFSYPILYSRQGKAADCEVVKVPTEQWKKHKKAEFAKKFLWRLEMAGSMCSGYALRLGSRTGF